MARQKICELLGTRRIQAAPGLNSSSAIESAGLLSTLKAQDWTQAIPPVGAGDWGQVASRQDSMACRPTFSAVKSAQPGRIEPVAPDTHVGKRPARIYRDIVVR